MDYKKENKEFLKENFYNAFYKGKRTLTQYSEKIYQKYDSNWVMIFENLLPSLDIITRDFKSVLRYEDEVLPLYKQKRIFRESIRHLSKHTENILEVRSDGTIVPTKLLVSQSDIEAAIYENRFIRTLIDRGLDFLSNQIRLLKRTLDIDQTTNFDYDSHFIFDNANYEIKVTIKEVKKQENDKTFLQNKKIYDRVTNLYSLMLSFTNSTFYKEMKKYSIIKPPIIKTQIILKNPNYHNGYFLWLLLDELTENKYLFERQTEERTFDDYYLTLLDNLMYTNFKTFYLENNHLIDLRQTSFEQIKPEINPNIKPIYTISGKPLDKTENLANEIYLKELKDHFNHILNSNQEGFYRSGERIEEVNLKDALTQMTEITNNIYQSYFDMNRYENVFSRITSETNLRELYNDFKQKVDIMGAIREVKEADYKNTLLMERKILEERNNIYKNLIEYIYKEEETHHSEGRNRDFDKYNNLVKEYNDKDYDKLLKKIVRNGNTLDYYERLLNLREKRNKALLELNKERQVVIKSRNPNLLLDSKERLKRSSERLFLAKEASQVSKILINKKTGQIYLKSNGGKL
ncbi:MAG: hypothetical protein ACOX02_05100 [Acholeplasmatales bacterium]